MYLSGRCIRTNADWSLSTVYQEMGKKKSWIHMRSTTNLFVKVMELAASSA